MSTRYPHDSHEDDLPPQRGAKGTTPEPDALDAVLNEVTQGNRPPTARPGTRHHTPNGRPSPASDLPGFAREFHQRAAATEAANPAGSALDPHLWERIMVTTTPNSTATTAPPRTARPSSHIGSAGRALPPGRSLRGIFANATLALLVILAGLGIWQVYDGLDRSTPPTTPDGSVPGLAMQPATPEATETPPAITIPDPAYACDFSADMPIISQVDESPVEGTAVLLTTTGDLILTCPEEPEPIILASDIGQAAPTSWPGIVYTATPLAEGTVQTEATYVNILTGKTVTIGIPQSESTQGINLSPSSPLLVHPMANTPEQWAVTDLRTMETRNLSSFVEEPAAFPPATPIMVSESGGVTVIGLKTANGIEGQGHLVDVDGLPGTLLVLNAATNESRWINIPTDLDPIIDMTIAPNGTYLALKTSDAEGDDPRGTVTYTIISTSDGTQVAQSEGIDDPGTQTLWAADGDAFVYTNGGNLMRLDPQSTTGEPATLLESSDVLSNPRLTYDPMVINIDSIQQEEVATETPDQVRAPQVLVVNVASGDISTIDGTDTSINLQPYEAVSRFMVIADTYVTSSEPATYRVVDAATGEELRQITDVVTPIGPGGYANLGLHAVASTQDGSTEVFGYNPGQLWLMTMSDEPVVRQLAPISGREDATQGMVSIFLSPDGSMLSLTIEGDESRTRWLLPLDAETDEWIEVPSTVPGSGPDTIFFATGTATGTGES